VVVSGNRGIGATQGRSRILDSQSRKGYNLITDMNDLIHHSDSKSANSPACAERGYNRLMRGSNRGKEQQALCYQIYKFHITVKRDRREEVLKHE